MAQTRLPPGWEWVQLPSLRPADGSDWANHQAFQRRVAGYLLGAAADGASVGESDRVTVAHEMVCELLKVAGFNPQVVHRIEINPWSMTVSTYERDEGGNMITTPSSNGPIAKVIHTRVPL